MYLMTGSQAKQARNELKLTQSKVANETDISRSYLSEFETEKRPLEDAQRELLCEYYSELGWTPDSGQEDEYIPSSGEYTSTHLNSLKIKDGIVIPSDHLSDEEIELVVENIYSLNDQIEQRLSEAPSKYLFVLDDEEATKEKALKALLLIYIKQQEQAFLQGSHNVGNEVPFTNKDPRNIGEVIEFLANSMFPSENKKRYLKQEDLDVMDPT